MRKRNRNLEIFSLAFLDLVTCGFGAVVLLILVAKPSEDITPPSSESAEQIISEITTLDQVIDLLKEKVAEASSSIATARQQLESGAQYTAELEKESEKTRKEASLAKESLEGLSLVEESLERASIRPATNTKKRDDEVGGIPVDSDYILFIVDTSGSMQQIWPKVMAEMKNVLAIHPKVKGFQILNDNGLHLVSAYNGKWIPDTDNRRNNVFKLLSNWRINSNSSPVEGLGVALKRYANPNISLSIYIIGDEYSGASYMTVLNQLDKLNRNSITGAPLAKIHALGFMSPGNTGRYATLMREVTKRSNGTFIGLPR